MPAARSRTRSRRSASSSSAARWASGAASLAALLYVVVGLVGLPFFAERKGGVQVVLGATGGYLVGFVLAGGDRRPARGARLGSADRRRDRRDARWAASSIYAVGVPWLAVDHRDRRCGEAIKDGLLPFLAVDTVKLLAAAAVFPAAWWVVGRRPSER